MPALPIIAETFRCVLHWTDSSSASAENVIHIRASSSGRTPAEIFTLIDAHVTTNMWGSVGGSGNVTDVSITPLDGTSATQDFATGSPAKWTGPGGGETIPASAALVKLTTGLRGRSNRGRIYIPMLSEVAQAHGVLVSGTVTAMQSAWTTFVDALPVDATTPAELVVASYKLATAVAVEVAFVEGVAATQRRRQGRLRSA